MVPSSASYVPPESSQRIVKESPTSNFMLFAIPFPIKTGMCTSGLLSKIAVGIFTTVWLGSIPFIITGIIRPFGYIAAWLTSTGTAFFSLTRASKSFGKIE